MLGPSPYKAPSPKTKDAQPQAPEVGGVVVPPSAKVQDAEVLSLAESPEVTVPSTYDDALRNDELLENIELVDEENLEVFPDTATKQEISFGIPEPEETDKNAFGGTYGTSEPPKTTQDTSPLTQEEKTVVLQNSVIVANVSTPQAEEGQTFELGTKLVGVAEGQERLNQILTTTLDLTDPDTEILEVEEFVVPPALEIVDGGEF